MPKSRRAAYSKEFKSEAIARVNGGESILAVADSLEISQQSLRNWLSASKNGKRVLAIPGRSVPDLRLENERLRCERDILMEMLEIAIAAKR